MYLTADVLIIGGGIAGLSLAAALAQETTVILAETEALPAYHASSRSARQMQPSYGPPQIRDLTEASIPLVEAIALEIDADLLRSRPLIWFATDGNDGAIVDMLKSSPHLQQVHDQQLRELMPALRVDRVTAAALDPYSFEVDVPLLVNYFAATALQSGLELLTNAPVTGAIRTKSGWEVMVGSDTVSVDTVVNASGAWGDEVGQLFRAGTVGLESYRRTVAIARPSLRQVDVTWPMVSDISSTLYFRPDGEKILMSPSDEDWMRPCDVKPATQDLEVVLKRINELTDLGVQRIERSWSGLRTFAPDRLPVAGFDPIVPNFYWLVGQGGYGIQTSAAVAQLVCADLLGRSSRLDPQLDEVFTSLRPERLAVQ